MASPDTPSPEPPYFLEFAPHYLEFLAEVRVAADLGFRGCQDVGWNPHRDVRPCFLSRMANLSRALSYLIACAHRGRDTPAQTLKTARLGDGEIHGALRTLYPLLNWGVLATWFGAFELALCDLARGICEQDSGAGFRVTQLTGRGSRRRRKRRAFHDVYSAVSEYALQGEDRRRFREFCALAGGLRNTVHMHGISDPWAQSPIQVRKYGEGDGAITVEFRRGKVPQVHGPIPVYLLWLELAPTAVVEWTRLLKSDAVRRLNREITDSGCAQAPPELETFIATEVAHLESAGASTTEGPVT